MRVESGKMYKKTLEELLKAKKIAKFKLYNWSNSCFIDDAKTELELDQYTQFKLIEHHNANKSREYIIVGF